MSYVIQTKDEFHEETNHTIPEDQFQTIKYNSLLKKVGLALEKWAVELSHNQRKEIYDALDWYNTYSLYFQQAKSGKLTPVAAPTGTRPMSMRLDEAEGILGEIHSITWLRLSARSSR